MVNRAWALRLGLCLRLGLGAFGLGLGRGAKAKLKTPVTAPSREIPAYYTKKERASPRQRGRMKNAIRQFYEPNKVLYQP